MNNILDLFLSPVREWFRTTLGTPTPPQVRGWPSIAGGNNTLILAPTGSGKTLAAFLACLDHLWRQPQLPRGVQVLYISPLKALNNDIHRNLQAPLEGVAEAARRLNYPLAALTCAVRTGDTSTAERQRLIRQPPHILITTPESLHLLLTSRGRETLRTVTHVIVDEIHALSPNKRGVFLSLLLERLAALTARPFVRIGLSATQRPLEEVARYLGGCELVEQELRPRPVTIIDAGQRKDLDLQVVSPVEQFGALPEKTIWPSIHDLLGRLIRAHRSTIIFANNRRSVERITAALNAESLGSAELPPFSSRESGDAGEQDASAFGLPLTARVGDEGDTRSARDFSSSAPPPRFGEGAGGRGSSAPPPRFGEGAGGKGSAPEVAASTTAVPSPPTPLPPGERGDQLLARAHHGSVALEVRQGIEEALKQGSLSAVVATASLEMGIDMGAVELVCQVESPGSVARGLQRVGRAGHLVGQKSKGRLIPKTLGDLLVQAVLAREMALGHVEEICVPQNCLDILAQQVVAMTAVDDWDVKDLYSLVRRAHPFRHLTPQALESVLEMVSGRYRWVMPAEGSPFPSPPVGEGQGGDLLIPSPLVGEGQGGGEPATAEEVEVPAGRPPHPQPLSPEGRGEKERRPPHPNPPPPGERGKDTAHPQPLAPAGRGEKDTAHPTLNALQPRISWDRVHNRLRALPGSQQLALVHGGTIPDTGQYAVYTTNGVRLGELDEEFIYERRVGDTFLLGTTPWRLEQIDTDRVLVSPAEGQPALVPFWRGEQAGRSYDLGMAIGRFLRECAQRLESDGVLAWLREEYFLDAAAARNLAFHVRRQQERTGGLPTDKTLFIEASRDELGDWQVILLSPLGSRVHLALRLVLEARLRQRLGYAPQCLHHDDGLLIRQTDSDEPILDLFEGLEPENVESLILDELADSALFALRFRQNAARALMLPKAAPGKRAPLWLQRLRGRDLLQVARRHPDFPIVVETFRECLHDHLDVPRLQQLLRDIRAGSIEVRTLRLATPSPFASGLLFAFNAAFQYQYDDTEAEPNRTTPLDTHLLEQLVNPERHQHLLDPRAVQQVERRLRGLGQIPRSATEMAEWLRRLGDLAPAELEGPMAAFLQELQRDGRATMIDLSGSHGVRWVLTEEVALYRSAFTPGDPQQHQAAEAILARFLATHALVSLDDIQTRYPFEPNWARPRLQEWARSGRVATVPPRSDAAPLQFSAPENLEQMQRSTLGILRREVMTAPATQFVDFLVRWQMLHPDTRRGGVEGLGMVLQRLHGLLLPAELWEQFFLPARVPGYQPRWLDECLASGAVTWACQGDSDNGAGQLAFLQRALIPEMPPRSSANFQLDRAAETVLAALQQKGALFVTDLSLHTQLSPATARRALWQLVRAGLVSNDRFDAIRTGEDAEAPTPTTRRSLRRPATTRPEGRWALLPWAHPDAETQALQAASTLLERYGVVARELAQLDSWLPPWRILYEVLSRLELTGEVRRGYFVEGFSGAQFALPEAARLLEEMALPSQAAAPAILVHSMDPTNLYGSAAPLDLPLLDGGTRSFLRRPGNWLVLRAGRPVLLIEQQGQRLSTLPTASEAEIAAAVPLLPELLRLDRSLGARHKLTVSAWNGQPVTSTPGAKMLEEIGFVRDYQDMTLYAAWQ